MSATVDPLWRIHPDGSLAFECSSAIQQEFIDSPAQEILFSGMYGSGKSVAGCVKLWKVCELYPGMRGAVMRRHYEDLKISTLRLFPRLFGERMWAQGVIGGPKEPSGFKFPNGSTLDFIGMSGDAERTKKLLSTEYGILMADEVNELSEGEWELAMGRLRQNTVPIRQAFGMCNPDSPHHWLYHRFHVAQGANQQWRDDPCPRCRSGARPECRVCGGTGKLRRLVRELFMSGAADNDTNHPAEYVAWRANLTGLRAARYRDGRWVAYAGGVFEKYDPNVHVCSRPADWYENWGGYPPPDWPRVRGIDLGFDNPFVCQWWAIDHDGHWWRYREVYRSNVTIPRHAERINALEAEELDTLRRCAEERGVTSEYESVLTYWYPAGSYSDHDKGERAQLEEAGIYTQPAKKDITAGLDKLIEMFDPDRPGGARIHLVRDALVDGPDQRLAFERVPVSTEEEIPGYVWDKTGSGSLAGRRKDLPVDRNNHGLDAMRYAVYSHSVAVQVGVY